MQTPEQIAAETAARHFDTYQDSAEEVGHPEGQPIVETWPQLRQCLTEAVEADRRQTIRPGDHVVSVEKPELDPRRVIAVGGTDEATWLWLDYQQHELNGGELPSPLPITKFRKI